MDADVRPYPGLQPELALVRLLAKCSWKLTRNPICIPIYNKTVGRGERRSAGAWRLCAAGGIRAGLPAEGELRGVSTSARALSECGGNEV